MKPGTRLVVALLAMFLAIGALVRMLLHMKSKNRAMESRTVESMKENWRTNAVTNPVPGEIPP